MEKLANLTPADVSNGALVRMLASAGIPDVSAYVKKFHEETEDLIIEILEHSDSNIVESDEQIVPPMDLQRWITGFRPRINDTNQQPLSEPEQQQQIPNDVQSWITGLCPHLDDSTQLPSEKQEEEQRHLLTDLNSWLQHIAPIGLSTASNTATTTTTTTTTTPSSSSTDVPAGNLGTWLNDWSKSLAQQPPPTSLDNWLQSLVSKNITEPIGKANSPKGRLNTYLNAAQKVLSQHGYDVSNEVAPPTNVKSNTGMFGNVKQMYFLWKTLDKNNDRKITVEDVQIMLQEMGLGFLSKYVAETLFGMVDSNHDGTLQFRDFVALMGIIKQLISAMGSGKA